MSDARYLWITCQVGSEIALKREVAASHPAWKFAYSRPGFVTFKVAQETPAALVEFNPGWIFARAWGLSLGKVSEAELPQKTCAHALAWCAAHRVSPPLRLHVFTRDEHAPGEEPAEYFPLARTAAAREQILQRPEARSLFIADEQPARAGDWVWDVVWVNENEWWLGAHRHAPGRSPHAGGISPLALPAEAPSRAYLKILELAEFAGVEFSAGETAVEIGSAPGGAVLALLQKGLEVVGVDPAEMAESTLRHPHFTHVRRSVADIGPQDLPLQMDWLLVDMNAEPRVSLPFIERVAASRSESLRGIFWTLKLNHPRLAPALPSYLERLRSLPSPRITRLYAAQLSSHRREIGVVALTDCPRSLKLKR